MFRIGQEEKDAVARVIDSGFLSRLCGDQAVEANLCEKEMRELFGADYALMMTSGHAALVSAMTGLGIGPGDEVIVPAYTFIATAMAVVGVGAMPIVAEINETMTLDAQDVERKITERTKAIVPVHIQGFPCDMDAICAVAKKHNLYVIEDTCQADGGSYKGKRLGTIGDAGALSFNQLKIISAGEGGALLTNNKQVFERSKILIDSNAISFFGENIDDYSEALFCGTEYRTNEIAAAIIRVQLTRLDGILTDLRRNKKRLMDNLSDICTFAPSNDAEGDCGTIVAFHFNSVEETVAFGKKLNGIVGYVLPINSAKHIYTGWDAIMNKKGACHPAMDPFLMPQNKVPEYTIDMCPKTLDYLSRTLYLFMDPNTTIEEIDAMTDKIRNAQ